MDITLQFVSFVLALTSALANEDYTIDDYYDYTPDDDFKNTKSVKQTTARPVANYEVTEIVQDIPNPNPPGPRTVSNFTINRPLNIIPNVTTDNIGQGNNNVNQNNKVNNNDIGKELSEVFSKINTELNAVTDKPFEYNGYKVLAFPEEPFEVDDEDHDVPDVIPNIAAYLEGIKRGVINGLHGLISKNVFEGSKSSPLRAPPFWHSNKLRYRNGHEHVENVRTHFDYRFED